MGARFTPGTGREEPDSCSKILPHKSAIDIEHSYKCSEFSTDGPRPLTFAYSTCFSPANLMWTNMRNEQSSHPKNPRNGEIGNVGRAKLALLEVWQLCTLHEESAEMRALCINIVRLYKCRSSNGERSWIDLVSVSIADFSIHHRWCSLNGEVFRLPQ